MKNIVPEIENMIYIALGMYFYRFSFIRNIKIAILNKDTSKTTLKNLICTVLQD